ncbi:MAG: DNA polymerase IV [Acidimicrobiia bacterium]|nr:DNA polymerase IV [Acidimicrobiia bacterium]
MAGPTILHADLDAFYASVEQLLDPTLRGKPIAVGGSVVLAASYEARRYGVQSGMPGNRARMLCPDLRFVRGTFDRYQSLADRVFTICEGFTPIVERISIDEAFLDVTGSEHLFGPAPEIAAKVRERVRDDVGLALSIGVASTKFLAKIGSQVAKPDGLVVVPLDEELQFLHPLPVGLMWGVGAVTGVRLAEMGISTIGELATTPPDSLSRLIGSASGRHLSRLARNLDPRPVKHAPRAKSVGSQSAFGRKQPTPELIDNVTRMLADRIGRRLRAKDRSGRTVTVRVRRGDMTSVTRSYSNPHPIASTDAIVTIARNLVADALESGPPEISLIGISVSNLVVGAALQLEFAIGDDGATRPGSERGRRAWDLDRSVDAVRERYGSKAVRFATLIKESGVPDAFRELAERD